MNTRVVFRNMEKSAYLEEQVRRELKRLDLFLANRRPPVVVDFTLTIQGPTHTLYQAELVVGVPGHTLVAHHEEHDVNLAIARVVENMHRQLANLKNATVDNHHRPDENHNPRREDKEDFEK